MKPRGGARPGAGRKPGKMNESKREAIERASYAIKKGVTPLEYLLQVMRSESAPAQMRFQAAQAAAPYVHPRLTAVEVKGDAENPLEVITRIELVAPRVYGKD